MLDDEESGPGHQTSPVLASLIVTMLEAEALDVPLARTSKLGAAALVLARGDNTLLRRIGSAAVLRSNAAIAIEAFSAIAPEDRCVEDGINLSFAHDLAGDTERAADTLPKIDEGASPDDEVFLLLNGASYALWRSPPPSGDELEVHRDQLERALSLFKKGAASRRPYLRSAIEGSLARVEFLAGELEAAERRLRAVSSYSTPQPKRQLLLGDVLWAKGDRVGARLAWEAALAAAHPESGDAEAARRRLVPEYR